MVVKKPAAVKVAAPKKRKRRKAVPKAPLLPECPSPNDCPVGDTPEICLDKSIREECIRHHAKKRLAMFRGDVEREESPRDMKDTMSRQEENILERDRRSYTWTIKDLIPLLITLLVSLGSVFQVYNALTTRITSLEKDMDYLRESTKKEMEQVRLTYQSINDKLDNINKTNESLKIQINELGNLVVSNKGRK
jgi:cell division protein FtsL